MRSPLCIDGTAGRRETEAITLQAAIEADIAALRAEYDRPDDDGVALVGSFARADAGPYSDLDLTWFRAEPATEQHKFFSRGPRLVSLLFTTVAASAARLSRPEDAIWSAKGLRDMHIISDRTGAISALRSQAAMLDWTALQASADRHASKELAAFGEEAAKLLNALVAANEYSAANAATWLWLGLAKAMAVHLGVLMTSENSWLAAVEVAAGTDTPWVRWFRGCAGLEPAPTGVALSLWRAGAGIRLYRETARRLDSVIQVCDRQTVATVSGYIDTWLAGHDPAD